MDTKNDVKKFMQACDQNEQGIESAQAKLYLNLIEEEFEELNKAFRDKDIVEIADACADLKWVIEGLENTLNLPAQEIWNEVARSNLSKISENGKVLKREDGKVIKPSTFSPPNIKKILED